MKYLKLIAIVLVTTFSMTYMEAQTKKIIVEKSKITWVGKKLAGQHEGIIKLKEGSLVFKGKKITGGNFTVDMNSLTATDLQGEYLNKLNGHLKSDDFFGTTKFATSTMVFKKAEDKGNDTYTVTADLTIKNITNPITFDITVNGNTAKTNFKINRTKYDIKYSSSSFFENLGDKVIYDDFDLDVVLNF